MTTIQTNVRYLRRLRGWNQEQFANKLHVKRALVGAWEEGRSKPAISVMKDICHIFKLSLEEFINKDLTATEVPLYKYGETADANPLIEAFNIAPEPIQRAVQVLLEPYSDNIR